MNHEINSTGGSALPQENSLETLPSIKRQTLNQKVYEELKQLLLQGQLPPGTKLGETQLARRLGTSATPVREAFRMLAAEGFLRIEPWKGAVVQGYEVHEIEEVFQCRQALETLGLQLTMQRLRSSPCREKALAEVEKELGRSRQAGGATEFVSSNSSIHDFWIRGSGNRRLIQLMDGLSDLLLHDRNLSAVDPVRRDQIIQEHIRILEAIRALDEAAAQAALQEHIQRGYQYSCAIRQGS